MRDGEVDGLMAPTFGSQLTPLLSTPGVTFEATPRFFFEHLDLEEGKKAQNPLLRAPWMRHAIMLGIDRQAIRLRAREEHDASRAGIGNQPHRATAARPQP